MKILDSMVGMCVLLVSVSAYAQANQRNATYGIECVGTSTLWSERSSEMLKIPETKVFRIVNGSIANMGCVKSSMANRIFCLQDIQKTGLPTIEGIKTIVEYDFETSHILVLKETKVSVTDTLNVLPELKDRIGGLKYITNDSLFRGQCKRQ